MSNHTQSNNTAMNYDVNATYLNHDDDDDAGEHVDLLDLGVRAQYFLSQPYYILALIISTAAILANLSSLAAIYQIRKGITSHFRILVSLIASDLLVDISAVAFIVNTIVHPLMEPGYGAWFDRITARCSFMVIKGLNTTGLNITLLNLMALAIDHYIAILRPFKLHSLMSKPRTILMIVIMWFTAFISGYSDFFSSLTSRVSLNGTEFNYCEMIWNSAYQEEYITFAIVIICFAAMLYMYLHIYCEVKGKHFSDTINDMKVHRNKRALITTLLILGTFIFCWLPICIFNIVLIIITKVGVSAETLQKVFPILKQVDKYLYDLMLTNTLLDPIIYAIRMHEVRRGYTLLLARCVPARWMHRFHGHLENGRAVPADATLVTNDLTRSVADMDLCDINGVPMMLKINAQRSVVAHSMELELLNSKDSCD